MQLSSIQCNSSQISETRGSADADSDVDAGADASTHVGAHPRPLDVLELYFKSFCRIVIVLTTPKYPKKCTADTECRRITTRPRFQSP